MANDDLDKPYADRDWDAAEKWWRQYVLRRADGTKVDQKLARLQQREPGFFLPLRTIADVTED